MVLRDLERDELTSLVELIRCTDVGALVHQYELMEVAVLARAHHTHGQILDASCRISNLHQLKRFTFVDAFKQWRLQSIIKY